MSRFVPIWIGSDKLILTWENYGQVMILPSKNKVFHNFDSIWQHNDYGDYIIHWKR